MKIEDDDLFQRERGKYEMVWEHPFYRQQADGDPVVDVAFKGMGCRPGESLIDWGCGCGRPAKRLERKGLKVTGFDIAWNCLDADVKIPLVVGCLWDPALPADLFADYAFCTDVLEHLPPSKLDDALDNIAARTRKAAFIQVCTVPDVSGAKLRNPTVLHLSVRPPAAWHLSLNVLWPSVEMEMRSKSRTYFLCRR